MTDPVLCPACTSRRIVEVVYGLPTHETEERANRGEVILGGDMLFGHERDYTWQCHECGQSWAMLEADEDEEEDDRTDGS